MADVAELAIEFGGAEEAVGTLKKISKGVTDLADNVKWGFIGQQIGNIADQFGGLAKAEMQATERLMKGFAAQQGGVAVVTEFVRIGIETWKLMREEATRALHAVEAEEQNAAVRARAADAGREVTRAHIDAINAATAAGLPLGEAEIAQKLRKIEIDIEAQRTTARLRAAEAASAGGFVAKGSTQESADLQARQALAFIKDLEAQKLAIEATADEQRALKRMAAAEKRRAEAKAAADRELADWDEFHRAQLVRQIEADDRLAAQRRTHENLLADRQIQAAQDAADREQRWEQKKAEQAQRMAQASADDEVARVQAAAAGKIAADAVYWTERGEKMEAEAARQTRVNEQILGAGLSVARSFAELALGEEQVTRAKLEAKAKQATIEAAFQAATAIGLAAVGNIPGATAAAISAASFAAIAGGNAIASTAAPTGSPRAGGSTVSTPAAPSRENVGSGGTVVYVNGGFVSDAGFYRGLRRSTREAERRR